MTKKVLVVGDTHAGSYWGLNHPDYVPSALKDKTDCLMLFDKWCQVVDAVGKIDYILHLGDSNDNINYIEQGDNIMQDTARQVEASVKLIKMFKGSPEIVVADGSGYHNKPRKLDNVFGEKVGARKDEKFGWYAWPDVIINVEGVSFHISHFIVASKAPWHYRTTYPARELLFAVLNECDTQIILRGHAHFFVYAGYATHLGMVIPAFQTQTAFMRKSTPFNKPKIGGVLFTVDKEGYSWTTKIPKIWEPSYQDRTINGGK